MSNRDDSFEGVLKLSDVEGLDVPQPLNANALRAANGASLFEFRCGPIGVFDSGLGGVSVWRHLHALMPKEFYIYFADNMHVPYGDKTEEWIRERLVLVTEWFLQQGCKTIVLACNTATAAGATFLRTRYPDVFFVGLEPAIKPAIELTRSGKVAMLATARTVESVKYQNLLAQTRSNHADIEVMSLACVGWAQAIDSGLMPVDEWNELLKRYLNPVREFGADVVVLGCTHYPFIADEIRAYLGQEVVVLDSGSPVARYTQSVLALRQGLRSKDCPQVFDLQSTQMHGFILDDKPDGLDLDAGKTLFYCSFLDDSVVNRCRYLSGQPNAQVHWVGI